MGYFTDIYKRYIKWRPTYYFRKWKMYQYLNNYINCVESKHTNYQFRNGYNLSYEEKSSAEHIFSEIFIGDCYPLARNNRDKKLIVDIGANIGFFTFYAKIKYPNSLIISVEADPNNFKVLSKNIYENNLSESIKIFNNVISPAKGKQPFYLSNNPGWSSSYNTRGAKNGEMVYLEPLSLSDLFRLNKIDKIDVLKIDVEGAEYDIMLNDDFLDNYFIEEIFVEVDKNPRDEKYTFSDLTNLLDKHFNSIQVINIGSEYPLIHCKKNNF